LENKVSPFWRFYNLCYSFLVYVDVDTVGGAMAATVNIDTGVAIAPRMWKILVRQIECNDVNL
jgi:hypothetical protein